MRTLIEFKDGRSEVYEDAGPNIYDGMLSLVGPDCEVVMDDTPLSEINRVVFVNEGEFHE